MDDERRATKKWYSFNWPIKITKLYSLQRLWNYGRYFHFNDKNPTLLSSIQSNFNGFDKIKIDIKVEPIEKSIQIEIIPNGWVTCFSEVNIKKLDLNKSSTTLNELYETLSNLYDLKSKNLFIQLYTREKPLINNQTSTLEELGINNGDMLYIDFIPMSIYNKRFEYLHPGNEYLHPLQNNLCWDMPFKQTDTSLSTFLSTLKVLQLFFKSSVGQPYMIHFLHQLQLLIPHKPAINCLYRSFQSKIMVFEAYIIEKTFYYLMIYIISHQDTPSSTEGVTHTERCKNIFIKFPQFVFSVLKRIDLNTRINYKLQPTEDENYEYLSILNTVFDKIELDQFKMFFNPDELTNEMKKDDLFRFLSCTPSEMAIDELISLSLASIARKGSTRIIVIIEKIKYPNTIDYKCYDPFSPTWQIDPKYLMNTLQLSRFGLPIIQNGFDIREVEQIDIILLDCSLSMFSNIYFNSNFTNTKLSIAIQLIKTFIDKLHENNLPHAVGLVTFNTNINILHKIDRKYKKLIDNLNIKAEGNKSLWTAIIETANLFEDYENNQSIEGFLSKNITKRIICITDGQQLNDNENNNLAIVNYFDATTKLNEKKIILDFISLTNDNRTNVSYRKMQDLSYCLNGLCMCIGDRWDYIEDRISSKQFLQIKVPDTRLRKLTSEDLLIMR